MPLRTLSTRIAFLAGLLALVGASALSYILIRSQRRQILAEVIHGSESLAETIRLSIDHDMRVNRRDGMSEMIESVGHHEGIEWVRLFNKEGRISYSSQPGEVGQSVDMRAEACVNCHHGAAPDRDLAPEDRSRVFTAADGRRIVGTIHVIRNEPGCGGAGCHNPPDEQSVLGVLDVAMSLEPTQARIWASTRNALTVSLAAVVMITGALFLVVWQSVRRPVSRMIAATRRVAAGDLTQHVPGASGEIGFLASSFNEMVESLNSSQRDLEAWASGLETKVAEKAEELRSAQFQVVQAEKLSSVGLVAAGIAHELNSPLMAIITFAHMVQAKLEPDSQSYKDVDMIVHEANRCAAIIRQLLDYSRRQAQVPDTEPVRISQVVERALELLKVEIKNGRIEVDTSVPQGLPIVEANEVQLMQVFVNLILNAVQAMDDGGRVSIVADVVPRSHYDRLKLPPHPGEKLVRVRVRDTGPGISREALRKVFDPFFTTKPVGQGSGLGLSVSLGLVRRYRGLILAESDGKTGTEFTVLLPVPTEPLESGDQ